MSSLEQEVADGIKVVRALLEMFEEKLARGEDLEAIRTTLVKLTSVLRNPHFELMLERGRGQPTRDIGFNREEALIVKSATKHGSIRAAVRAYDHSPKWNEEYCESVTSRIYGRIREIKAVGLPLEDAIALALLDDDADI
jgi:hypothetical protein